MAETVFEILKKGRTRRRIGEALSEPFRLTENMIVGGIVVAGAIISKGVSLGTSLTALATGGKASSSVEEVGNAVLVKEALMDANKAIVNELIATKGAYVNNAYSANEVSANANIEEFLKDQSLDKLVYSQHENLQKKSWDEELHRLESGLSEEFMHRLRDGVLFSNIHLWLNWDAEINAMACTTYNWNDELDTVGKALGEKFRIKKESDPLTKAFKHVMVPTERYTLRAVNDSGDFIPLIFNNRKNLTFFNLGRAGGMVLGSIFASESRTAKATALVYGDLTKDATNRQVSKDFESTLYFQYEREKFSEVTSFILQLLERQTEISRILKDPNDPKHEEIKNLRSPISTYQVGTKEVREPKYIKIFGQKVGGAFPGEKITKPVFDNFTYAELYGENGEKFSQEMALKVAQIEIQPLMQDLAKIGRIKHSGNTIIFTQFMNTLVNYVNNMNAVKGKNDTGLEFFNLNIEKGEIPKTQKVWNEDEEKFLLCMVANMVHGHTPDKIKNFMFANPDLVSCDPQKVNAGFLDPKFGGKYKDMSDFLEKKYTTELAYALTVPEVPRGTERTEFTRTVFDDNGNQVLTDGLKTRRPAKENELRISEKAERLVANFNIEKKQNLIDAAKNYGCHPSELLQTREEIILYGGGMKESKRSILGKVAMFTAITASATFSGQIASVLNLNSKTIYNFEIVKPRKSVDKEPGSDKKTDSTSSPKKREKKAVAPAEIKADTISTQNLRDNSTKPLQEVKEDAVEKIKQDSGSNQNVKPAQPSKKEKRNVEKFKLDDSDEVVKPEKKEKKNVEKFKIGYKDDRGNREVPLTAISDQLSKSGTKIISTNQPVV
jgi:hypothetical protein